MKRTGAVPIRDVKQFCSDIRISFPAGAAAAAAAEVKQSAECVDGWLRVKSTSFCHWPYDKYMEFKLGADTKDVKTQTAGGSVLGRFALKEHCNWCTYICLLLMLTNNHKG